MDLSHIHLAVRKLRANSLNIYTVGERELGGDIITKDIICVYWSANKARGTAASVIHRSPAVDLESE